MDAQASHTTPIIEVTAVSRLAQGGLRTLCDRLGDLCGGTLRTVVELETSMQSRLVEAGALGRTMAPSHRVTAWRARVGFALAEVTGGARSVHYELVTASEALWAALTTHRETSSHRSGGPALGRLVLFGDAMLASAFEAAVRCHRLDVLQLIADAAARTSEGSVMAGIWKRRERLSPFVLARMLRERDAALISAAAMASLAVNDVASAPGMRLNRFGLRLACALAFADEADHLSYTRAPPGRLARLAAGRAPARRGAAWRADTERACRAAADFFAARASWDIESVISDLSALRPQRGGSP